MSLSPSTMESRVRTYLRAKDENRPHLMEAAFAPEVALETVVKSTAITLPSWASGIDAVADVLVRDFGRQHENIYSFCLQRPLETGGPLRFDCDWLVAMSVKTSREVRVGCGRYEWHFQDQPPFLVSGLRITIEVMQTLPPRAAAAVYRWAAGLPYPWCTVAEALARWPDEPLLNSVREHLAACLAGPVPAVMRSWSP